MRVCTTALIAVVQRLLKDERVNACILPLVEGGAEVPVRNESAESLNRHGLEGTALT